MAYFFRTVLRINYDGVHNIETEMPKNNNHKLCCNKSKETSKYSVSGEFHYHGGLIRTIIFNWLTVK